MATSLLIIDDDSLVSDVLGRHLTREGYQVTKTACLEQAHRACDLHDPEIVLLDHQLPDGNALHFLKWAKDRELRARVVVLTGHGSIPLAVDAVKLGAEQFLTKPVDLASLRVLLRKLVEQGQVSRRALAPRCRGRDHRHNPFVGTSEGIRRVEELARSVAGAAVSVLLHGETGTGKGVLARWLHDASRRSDEAFVDLNCAGLSKDLVESELFGHKRGSFTGAAGDKRGLLELAHRGTLFLDEVGDLDPAVQPKLLKAIEERTFRRLGGVRERRVDVRLITATHKDLSELVKAGSFRNDLLFRINTVTIELPPLRERREDIIAIARDVLASLNGGRSEPGMALSAEAEAVLVSHSWPGNVREMRNVLERAVLFSRGSEISAPTLMLGDGPRIAASRSCSSSLADLERLHVVSALKTCSGNVPEAAAVLGIPRSSLYAKLKRWGLKPSEL